MRFVSLTVRNYRVHQELTVRFDPSRNLIGGPNEQGVYGVVTRGYAPGEQVLAVLRDWIASIAA